MKKLLLLLGVIFCVGNVVHAYDFGYQNLVYNIINESTHEVEITYVEDGRGNADFYTGDMTIPPSSVRAFELNFGSEEAATRIDTLAKENEAGTWYTLQGVRLDGQPTETGVYINGTKKVFIP